MIAPTPATANTDAPITLITGYSHVRMFSIPIADAAKADAAAAIFVTGFSAAVFNWAPAEVRLAAVTAISEIIRSGVSEPVSRMSLPFSPTAKTKSIAVAEKAAQIRTADSIILFADIFFISFFTAIDGTIELISA